MRVGRTSRFIYGLCGVIIGFWMIVDSTLIFITVNLLRLLGIQVSRGAVAWAKKDKFKFTTFPKSVHYDNSDGQADDYIQYKEDPFSVLQLFPLNDEISVIVESVEYCPEETAIIRVVSDNCYSKQYRRRVFRENGVRYFMYDGQRMNLRDEHTKSKVKGEEL